MRSENWLFYGGIAVAIGALLILIIYICVSRAATSHIRKQLKEEYGDEVKIEK